MTAVNENEEYITQDMSWNSANSIFDLVLHTSLLSERQTEHINGQLSYDSKDNAEIASAEVADTSVIIHCKCKKGAPTGRIGVRFESGASLRVTWPGVSRIFVRIRIMHDTPLTTMMDMLEDDIENRHSVSDVEYPDQDQSFRPWSDEEDSDNGTE